MKNKAHYYAWAQNEQGASMDVTHETSIRACEDEARRTLGSGWKVHIMRSDEFGIEEVKTFRIR